MIKEESLKLNEAIISVNKSAISSSPIGVFFQNKECFGCPSEKLIELKAGEAFESFKIDSRFDTRLELHQEDAANNVSCQLDNLSLNSHAHYRIDVSLAENEKLICKFETIDSGDCLLCPLAVLISIIFVFMALEWVYLTFFKSRLQKLPSSSSSEADVDVVVDGSESNNSSDANKAIDSTHNEDSQQSSRDQTSGETDQAKHNREASSSASPIGRLVKFERLNRALGSRSRIECLDAFRGLTIAGMIFVNYGGAGYTIWEHKPWNGITLADFVFPFFIFLMGASIAISIRAQLKSKKDNKLTLIRLTSNILRRSLVLMTLGICLNSKWLDFEQSDSLTRLRLTGVLQRFSVSYLVVAITYATELTINKCMKSQSLSQVPYLTRFVGIIIELLMSANFLVIYLYITFFLEYDSLCPTGYTGPGGQTEGGKYANCTGGAAAWLDRLVLGEKHLYNDQEVRQVFKTQVSHDPEGLLGYTTSILLTLIGLQCGKILMWRRADLNHRARLIALVQWMVALAVSCSLVVIVPINKRLWSLTFVVVTSLAAFVIVSILYILLDVYAHKKTFLIRLLISAGKNSIFLYVGHSLIHNLLPFWFPISDQSSHLQLLLRLSWATLVWLLIAHYMASKKLYIKV